MLILKITIYKHKDSVNYTGYLKDQNRVLTNTGSWLRDWSSESWDFIPIGPSSLITAATTTGNVGTGFVANNLTFKALATNQPALYICERIGKYLIDQYFCILTQIKKKTLSVTQ